eukprot:763527-Hanusia_phi.AAC.1
MGSRMSQQRFFHLLSLSSLLFLASHSCTLDPVHESSNEGRKLPTMSEGMLKMPLVLIRLRGGAKTKPTKPRSWKEQSVHHRRIRKRSIYKNRGKNAQRAYLNPNALKVLKKADDMLRLKQLEKKDAERKQKKANLVDTVEHTLRMQYMKRAEEIDKKRAEKYQTLDDYSDSIERELEELRQKRDENRALVLPDWRGEHPTFWKEVEEMNEGETDLHNPEKVRMTRISAFSLLLLPQVWNAFVTTGNTWQVAAYNRMMMNQQSSDKQLAISEQTLTTRGDGSGGGMILAAQSMEDTGPMVFEEISSADVKEAEAEEREMEEAETKELEAAKAEKAQRKKKKKKERAIEMPTARREEAFA